MSDFPRGFKWGTAASSTQSEGAAPSSDWARWERLGHAPSSKNGNGFALSYRDDFALANAMGLRHHRLSLEWARLVPSEGRHDPAVVEHYRQLLTAARDAGIEIWVCMHHFSLPGWFGDDMGGFLDDRGLGYFWPRHVDWVAETFGDLVAGWMPINEPLAYAESGWLHKSLPPGVADLARFADALRAAHLANIGAWRLLRSGKQPVATAMNLSPVTARAIGDGHDAPTQTAREKASEWSALIDSIHWDSWISLLRDGMYDDPFGAPVAVPDAAGAFDFVGFSYHHAVSVDQRGEQSAHPERAPKGPLGQSRFPEGLRECLDRLSEQLPDHRLLISAVGLDISADEVDADAIRCDYMRSIIDITREALRDGIDVAGLFWRTGIDSYEWMNGFDVQFGLLRDDREPTEASELAAHWAQQD